MIYHLSVLFQWTFTYYIVWLDELPKPIEERRAKKKQKKNEEKMSQRYFGKLLFRSVKWLFVENASMSCGFINTDSVGCCADYDF